MIERGKVRLTILLGIAFLFVVGISVLAPERGARAVTDGNTASFIAPQDVDSTA